jgi:hypothetical protein
MLLVDARLALSKARSAAFAHRVDASRIVIELLGNRRQSRVTVKRSGASCQPAAGSGLLAARVGSLLSRETLSHLTHSAGRPRRALAISAAYASVRPRCAPLELSHAACSDM